MQEILRLLQSMGINTGSGKSISNIYDYMYRLAELKTGQSV